MRSHLLSACIPLTIVPVSAIAATFPIAVSTSTNIAFGTLDPGVSGGQFRVRPDGSSAPLGGSTVTSLGPLAVQPGQISLAGSTGVAIDLSIATATVVLNGNAGGAMNVNDFNIRTNAGGLAETITLTSTTDTFPVGATLTVSAGQTPGAYTGTFTLNASYQ